MARTGGVPENMKSTYSSDVHIPQYPFQKMEISKEIHTSGPPYKEKAGRKKEEPKFPYQKLEIDHHICISGPPYGEQE